jgi:hypothetical protein
MYQRVILSALLLVPVTLTYRTGAKSSKRGPVEGKRGEGGIGVAADPHHVGPGRAFGVGGGWCCQPGLSISLRARRELQINCWVGSRFHRKA